MRQGALDLGGPPDPRLYAVTVHQPDAGLLAIGMRPAIDRVGPPVGLDVGDRVAIYASRAYDPDRWARGYALVERASQANPMLARLLADRAPWEMRGAPPNPLGTARGGTPYGALVGVGTLDEVRREPRADDPWWRGPVGWYLRDAVAFEGVACGSGGLGLWRPSPAVVMEVSDRVRAALSARRAATDRIYAGRAGFPCQECGGPVVSAGVSVSGVARMRCRDKGCADFTRQPWGQAHTLTAAGPCATCRGTGVDIAGACGACGGFP